mmetsp:Transcript_1142/g.3134  ORF Transcript_1142/g.3134 Transcript_1142/m.3134 type:complete len:244 (+) Transcript_1142:714-1445(+)
MGQVTCRIRNPQVARSRRRLRPRSPRRAGSPSPLWLAPTTGWDRGRCERRGDSGGDTTALGCGSVQDSGGVPGTSPDRPQSGQDRRHVVVGGASRFCLRRFRGGRWTSGSLPPHTGCGCVCVVATSTGAAVGCGGCSRQGRESHQRHPRPHHLPRQRHSPCQLGRPPPCAAHHVGSGVAGRPPQAPHPHRRPRHGLLRKRTTPPAQDLVGRVVPGRGTLHRHASRESAGREMAARDSDSALSV